MTAKLSGTDGLLQQYDYQTPSTGFSYTFAAGTQTLFMVPSGTLASGTITMPSAPSDGMVITFSSSQQITALTLQGNTGQSVSSAVTFLPAKTAASYVYRLANTTWYPCQTVPGTGDQLVRGTAVSSTSGTSIDFTGIPSWAKRITVMLNGVSLNSTSSIRFQIGDSGGVETTGYASANVNLQQAATVTVQNITAGFDLNMGIAGDAVSGHFVLTNISGNIWIGSGVFASTSGNTTIFNTAGTKTTSDVLDRVRITTVNGTDTFDLGSINILYE